MSAELYFNSDSCPRCGRSFNAITYSLVIGFAVVVSVGVSLIAVTSEDPKGPAMAALGSSMIWAWALCVLIADRIMIHLTAMSRKPRHGIAMSIACLMLLIIGYVLGRIIG
jgi:hypothetical protein